MDRGLSEEFCGVELGDRRLNRRLVMVAEALEHKAEESICAAIGDFHACKAAYRLFANPKLRPEKILEPHIQRSLARAKESSENLLIVHDTTELAYGRFKSIKDLGVLTTASGMKQGLRGIGLHNSLLITESGIPLGIIRQSFFTKEDYRIKRGQAEKNLVGVNKKYCLEDKASFRWIEHLNSCHAMLSPVGKEVIHVADRESDIYEFLQTADELDAKYVVRSMANRRIKTGTGTKDTSTLDAKLLSTESLGTTKLEISDENGRVQLHHMLVKAVQVSLFCPQRNVQSQKVGALKPLRVWIVEIASLEEPGLRWRLLTNLECADFNDAIRIMNIYRQRWSIETYHRAIKSGYGIEEARLGARARLENLCALLSILAWRVMWLYLTARHFPQVHCSALFSPEEMQILSLSKFCSSKDPQKLLAGEAVTILARIGGFLARKSDGPPGMTSIWKGLRILGERIEFIHEMTYG